MQKCFLIVALILVNVLILINGVETTEEIKTVIEQNVIAAKYEDGFIVVELESDSEKCSTIERYDISLVTIKYIDEEKSCVNKYLNENDKLKKVILFYNDESLERIL